MKQAIATSEKAGSGMAFLLLQHKLHVFLDTAASVARPAWPGQRGPASLFAGSTNLGHEPIIMKRAIATSEKAGSGMAFLLTQQSHYSLLSYCQTMLYTVTL